MNEVLVRRAIGRDLDPLVELENAAFAVERISRRQMRRHLDSRSAEVIVAIRAARIVGAAIVFFRRGSTVARLYSIAVAAGERGCGIGEALLAAATRAARRRGHAVMRLEVRVDNTGAHRWYERNGYHRFGRHDHYYEDGADAFRYEKRVDVATPRDGAQPSRPGRG